MDQRAWNPNRKGWGHPLPEGDPGPGYPPPSPSGTIDEVRPAVSHRLPDGTDLVDVEGPTAIEGAVVERPARDPRLRIPVPAAARGLLVGLACCALISGCVTPATDSDAMSGPVPSGAPVTSAAGGPGTPSGGLTSGYPAESRRGIASQAPAGTAKVSVFGPLDDAPGASILTVVTAGGAAPKENVRFDVRLAGQAGECVGDQWTHAGGRSQACWVTLPRTAGQHLISAYAELTGPGGTKRRTATQTRPVTGKGPVTTSVTPAERDRILRCGNTTDRVQLTFDDGFLSSTTMTAMLATLERENVKARFFATGQWARRHSSWLAQLRRAGHLIGNHSSTHEWLNTLTDARLREQIARAAGRSATAAAAGIRRRSILRNGEPGCGLTRVRRLLLDRRPPRLGRRDPESTDLHGHERRRQDTPAATGRHRVDAHDRQTHGGGSAGVDRRDPGSRDDVGTAAMSADEHLGRHVSQAVGNSWMATNGWVT